jgi:AraC family transcriptional regulator, arabinose operon regulatory protein
MGEKELIVGCQPVPADPFFRIESPATQMPFRVRALGYTANLPRHMTRGTYFDDAMLMVFVSGRGTFKQHGRVREMTAGTVAIVLPEGDTGVLMSDEEKPYAHLHARFNGSLALEIARRVVKARGAHIFQMEGWRDLAAVLKRGLMAWPGFEFGERKEMERFRPVDANLAEALAMLDAPVLADGPGISRARLAQYIHQRIDGPINLDEMAKVFGVSKSHLCRVAKQELGTTIHDHWESLKMAWARTLLKDATLSVGQVAGRLGYADPFYFSKVFKQHEGRSPDVWRRG